MWRLVWTLVAVAVLMFGGFVIAVTLIPVATLFLRDEQARNRRTLHIIRDGIRLALKQDSGDACAALQDASRSPEPHAALS